MTRPTIARRLAAPAAVLLALLVPGDRRRHLERLDAAPGHEGRRRRGRDRGRRLRAHDRRDDRRPHHPQRARRQRRVHPALRPPRAGAVDAPVRHRRPGHGPGRRRGPRRPHRAGLDRRLVLGVGRHARRQRPVRPALRPQRDEAVDAPVRHVRGRGPGRDRGRRRRAVRRRDDVRGARPAPTRPTTRTPSCAATTAPGTSSGRASSAPATATPRARSTSTAAACYRRRRHRRRPPGHRTPARSPTPTCAATTRQATSSGPASGARRATTRCCRSRPTPPASPPSATRMPTRPATSRARPSSAASTATATSSGRRSSARRTPRSPGASRPTPHALDGHRLHLRRPRRQQQGQLRRLRPPLQPVGQRPSGSASSGRRRPTSASTSPRTARGSRSSATPWAPLGGDAKGNLDVFVRRYTPLTAPAGRGGPGSVAAGPRRDILRAQHAPRNRDHHRRRGGQGPGSGHPRPVRGARRRARRADRGHHARPRRSAPRRASATGRSSPSSAPPRSGRSTPSRARRPTTSTRPGSSATPAACS